MHWENANVIGNLAQIPTALFSEIMNDVLSTFLVYKASCSGVQQLASLLEGRNQPFNLGQASYVSGLEKILSPLVLVFLRERGSHI